MVSLANFYHFYHCLFRNYKTREAKQRYQAYKDVDILLLTIVLKTIYGYRYSAKKAYIIFSADITVTPGQAKFSLIQSSHMALVSILLLSNAEVSISDICFFPRAITKVNEKQFLYCLTQKDCKSRQGGDEILIIQIRKENMTCKGHLSLSKTSTRMEQIPQSSKKILEYYSSQIFIVHQKSFKF